MNFSKELQSTQSKLNEDKTSKAIEQFEKAAKNLIANCEVNKTSAIRSKLMEIWKIIDGD